jgi:hypothetical protein
LVGDVHDLLVSGPQASLWSRSTHPKRGDSLGLADARISGFGVDAWCPVVVLLCRPISPRSSV